MQTLFWFRQDLRIQDNHGLTAALKNSSQILPIFIVDTKLLQQFWWLQDPRLGFIKDSLINLQQQLQKTNLNLLVLVGDPEALVPSLVRENSIWQVYINKAYDTYGIGRDLRVRLALREMGVQMHVENDYLLVAPEVLKPYQIFSPYSRSWEKVLNSDTYQLPRDKVALLFPSCDISQITQKSLDQLPSSHPYRKFQNPLKILKKFDFKNYDEKRNMLGAGGTSKISPYLRFGVISSRQLYHLAHQANNQTFIKELARREFRYQLSYHFPEVLVQSFQAKRRGIPRDNDRKLFEAFCQGKTWYPIIDAAIQQLKTENRMHGRARMIVASFLTKDLLIDRKRWEEFFKKHLLDYDQIVNIWNRQRSASVGADPRPLRIFSPILQAQRFDPEAKYIKKYLPELKNIPAEQLHDPLTYSLKYIQPIVDHRLATKKAKLVYDQAKSEYYEENYSDFILDHPKNL